MDILEKKEVIVSTSDVKNTLNLARKEVKGSSKHLKNVSPRINEK